MATTRAATNRDRILNAAGALLAVEPEASMGDVARAAGVVRRTVYAHFPTRDALIAGLAGVAATDILAALAATDRRALPPDIVPADFALTLWTTGDHYPLLISLSRPSLGPAAFRDLPAPIGAHGSDLLTRARDSGRFATHLPVPVLGAALQAMTLAMLEAVNDGLFADDGVRAATAVLVAAGLPPAGAATAVRRARGRIRPAAVG